jgi:hypothetical protein
MLMGAHNGAVDHRIFVVGIGREVMEHPEPHARSGPAAETAVDIDRIAKAL